MENLREYFEVKVSSNKMQAVIVQSLKLPEEAEIKLEDFNELMKEYGITFGIKEELLQKLVETPELVEFPLIIAEGTPPVNGDSAYLLPKSNKKKKQANGSVLKVDFKQVFDIPSVVAGELIGEKVPATEGTPGMDVFGEEIPAKSGKDFKLRKGKNTRLDDDDTKIYATLDGQMTVEKKKVIHVYPSYDVKGDLSMKTGNVSFVGHVNIFGNVPSGFEVYAKGDIHIKGTVEAATLISEGSIYVASGIVGQGKGKVQAKEDLHAIFLNQANVEIEGDIHVSQSILHSQCQAGGSIYCNNGKGNIVGGALSAGFEIIAKDIGNSMNTATSLFLGVNKDTLEKEKLYRGQVAKAEDDIKKLEVLKANLTEKEKKVGLSPNERIMMLRVRNTLNQLQDQLVEALENLEDLKEFLSGKEQSAVKIEDSIYPNVDITFGKYRRKIITVHKFMKISLEGGEITTTPL